ncbi:MAG: hypothetical protein Q7J67_02445 [bacterium]|nr:hypothetical protein [bacterium]
MIISGIGWISKGKYGCVKKAVCTDYTDIKSLHSKLQNESIFLYPVKNFGRFDMTSKMSCCAGALALHDAGVKYSEKHKQDIGIISTNTDGCLKSNLNYFRDYVQTGRKLARGNLFIYTLPSSPLAEASIHFGFQGPLLYIMFPQKHIPSLLQYAEGIISRKEASTILAMKVDEKKAVCFVLRREEDTSSK